MKVIVVGEKSTGISTIAGAIIESGFDVDEIVVGSGVGIPLNTVNPVFPTKIFMDKLPLKGAAIHKFGQMAQYADAMIILGDVPLEMFHLVDLMKDQNKPIWRTNVS